MKREESRKLKQKIKRFFNSKDKFIEINYKNDHPNPTKYYHKMLAKNPFSFTAKYLINGICYVLPASNIKNLLYRLLGMKIGKDVSISAGVMFDLGYHKLISIGDGTIIGTGVKILTHETTINRIRIGRVNIGKKVLIGVRSTIRSGVSIGDYAVVGAMSFVNKDVNRSEFVGGVPAKFIKKLKSNI